MLGIFHALRSALNPTRTPVRISRHLRGPDREVIGTVDDVRSTPEGVEVRATLSPAGQALIAAAPLATRVGLPAIAEAWLDAHGSDVKLEPWQRHVLLGEGVEVSPRVARPILDAENRRAAIAELQVAEPRPDLEALRRFVEAHRHVEEPVALAALDAAVAAVEARA